MLDYKDFQELIGTFVKKVEDDPEEIAKLSDFEKGRQEGYKDIIDAFYELMLETVRKLPAINSGVEDWQSLDF